MKIDLRHQLAGFQLQVQAQLPSRGITAIAGPSGAGKTTLLRLIAGFIHGQGSLHFGDETIQDDKVFLAPENRQFGYVTQDGGLFPHLSVARNLSFAVQRARAGGVPKAEVCAALGIEHLLAHQPKYLSGGERQRVCLARSLLANPKLLLLDEPFAALDEEAREQLSISLRYLLQELNIPALLVAHEFATLIRLADYGIYLENGKLHAQGLLNQLLIDANLPFANREDACVVLPARNVEYDSRFELVKLRVGQHLLSSSAKPSKLGADVYLRIRASDVSLSRQPKSRSSIQNSIETTLLELRANNQPPGQVLAVLDANDFLFLARLTKRAVAELDLKIGSPVFAQIKASTVLTH